MKGRRTWSCGPRTALLLSVLLPRDAAAMFQGSGKRDTVHKVFKVKVTEDVRAWSDDAEIKVKRAGDQCPTSYSLCASSLGGDCCPDHYACAQSSCYATTAAQSTCQGQTGYYACALSLQGGCCPQGLVCASDTCSTPAGVTYAETCPTGYFLCPSSVSYGCCQTGMGCAVSSCYSTSPSTTTITYTTTTDGSVETVTTTSVTTPASATGVSSGTGDGGVAKFYPSTEAKAKATGGSDSSSSGDGLSKGAIGGIVAGAAIVLIAVLIASFLVVRQLKRTEKVVQSHRETTSGTRTRREAEKRSEPRVRIEPTPTEVDGLEDDPLMVGSSVATPRRTPQAAHGNHGRSRSGSDAGSQPSVWSGPSAGMRDTPSLASEVDGDHGHGHGRGYFGLPPRVHSRPGIAPPMRHSMASSEDSSAHQLSYHNFFYAPAHGRHPSEASELSAGSDEHGGPRPRGASVGAGAGGQPAGSSPPPSGGLAPGLAFELGVEGEFRPELPGSDTETESNAAHAAGRRHHQRQHRRPSTNPSINNVVSPVSETAAVGRPPLSHHTTPPPPPSRGRRRGNSAVSPLDSQHSYGGGGGAEGGSAPAPSGSALGSIEESLTGTGSLHGHYGPPISGPTSVPAMDIPSVPGFGPIDGNYDEERRPDHDGGQGR